MRPVHDRAETAYDTRADMQHEPQIVWRLKRCVQIEGLRNPEVTTWIFFTDFVLDLYFDIGNGNTF